RRLVPADTRPSRARPPAYARSASLPHGGGRPLRLVRARHRVELGALARPPEREAPRPLAPPPRRRRPAVPARRDHPLAPRHPAPAAVLARLPVQRPMADLRRLPADGLLQLPRARRRRGRL